MEDLELDGSYIKMSSVFLIFHINLFDVEDLEIKIKRPKYISYLLGNII